MKLAQQPRLNEWLLGSTVMCPSCSCMWLIPTIQSGESYRCRQCGSEVTAQRTSNLNSEQPQAKLGEVR